MSLVYPEQVTASLLASFVNLNNLALNKLSASGRSMTGVHTRPGGDGDRTHGADIDYSELLPTLKLDVTNLHVAAGAALAERVVEGTRVGQ